MDIRSAVALEAGKPLSIETVQLSGPRVVVLRVFIKKTQKTPQSEIDMALARAKEIKK